MSSIWSLTPCASCYVLSSWLLARCGGPGVAGTLGPAGCVEQMPSPTCIGQGWRKQTPPVKSQAQLALACLVVNTWADAHLGSPCLCRVGGGISRVRGNSAMNAECRRGLPKALHLLPCLQVAWVGQGNGMAPGSCLALDLLCTVAGPWYHLHCGAELFPHSHNWQESNSE